MDKSTCKKIVGKHISRLRWALQLQDWDVEVHYGAIEKDDAPGWATKATCQDDPKYMTALIRIDPAEHDTKEEVLETLRHELCHLIDAEYNLYWRMVHQLIIGDDMLNALDEVYNQAKERTQRRVECMLLHGLGYDAEGLMRRSKKVLKRR